MIHHLTGEFFFIMTHYLKIPGDNNMIIGFLVIIIFPFIYFYTQANKLGQKTSSIKKAMDEGKETYTDTVDMCTRWTETGEKVYRSIWHYHKTHPEQDAIEGDDVLFGLNTYRVYRNYTKERFVEHVQRQIDSGKCWCFERAAFNQNSSKDYVLRYNMKEKYFYHLGWDWNTHSYFVKYHGTDKIVTIDYDRYKELGGYDWKDQTKGYRR